MEDTLENSVVEWEGFYFILFYFSSPFQLPGYEFALGRYAYAQPMMRKERNSNATKKFVKAINTKSCTQKNLYKYMSCRCQAFDLLFTGIRLKVQCLDDIQLFDPHQDIHDLQ